MNEIEKAIDGAMHSINMLLKEDKIDYENYKTLRDALKEKAERDKIRCENCKYQRTNECATCCETSNGTVFYFLDEDTDFCSYFEPKESEGK